jgi:hypothetical protein
MGNFPFIKRLEKKTNWSSALWESMGQKTGASLQRIYPAGLANNAEKDGTII